MYWRDEDMMARWFFQLCGWLAVINHHATLTSAECKMYPVVNETTVYVPLNGESTFMCNVSGGKAQLYVKNLDNVKNLDTDLWWPDSDDNHTYNAQHLRDRGINAQYVDPSRSDAVNVTVNGSAPNLGGIVITCCCYDDVQLPVDVFMATVITYGTPSPPVNLTLSEIAGTRVNLSWTPPLTPPGVIVCYRVIIADLGNTLPSPTAQLCYVTHYEMDIPNCLHCELTVVARNGAGESAPSNSVMFPASNTSWPSRSITSSSSSALSPSSSSSSSTSSPVLLFYWIIVAPIIGGLIVVVLAAVCIVVISKYRRTRKSKSDMCRPISARDVESTTNSSKCPSTTTL